VAEAEEVEARRRPFGRLVALALLLLVLVALLIVWSQRSEIAGGYIDRELARRGVQAHYEITHLGLGRQRLENVRIGDPEHPDATARWVEIELSYGLRAPKLRMITARGVRLFGRLVDGRLALGQIDKLLPPPTGAPFRLPDLRVDLADTAMQLVTPAGRIGLAVEGKGNLADGFRGRVAAVSRRLAFGDCVAEASVANLAVFTAGRRPTLTGPVRTPHLACGDRAELSGTVAIVDATLAQALDGWIGSARLTSAAMRSGNNRLAGVQGRVTFAGDKALTKGRADLAAAGARLGDSATGGLTFAGNYSFGGDRITLAGNADARNVVAGPRLLAPVVAPLASLDGTPLGPLGRAIGAAAARAAHGFDASTALRFDRTGTGSILRLDRLSAASRSGARLALARGQGLALDLARGAARLDGSFTLTGGGFPAIDAELSQPRAGALLSGVVRVSPFAANGARLALTPVTFAGRPDGTTAFATTATMDGPLSDARVTGLVLPLRGRFGRGGFSVGEGCTPAQFQALRYGSLDLLPARLTLCPAGPALLWKRGGGSVQGGAEVRKLALAGRLGSSPLGFASERFRFNLADRAFTSCGTAIRLGRAGSVNRLDLASLGGRIVSRGVAGGFAGASGKIANVPLLLSEGRGRWQVIGGRAAVDGAMIVSDEASPSRFYPLRTDDFHLTLVGSRIDAAAWLRDGKTGTRITRATIAHALDTGHGRALLDVPGIAFDGHYQPEQLTRLTVGVVALVKGVVKGEGEIVWSPQGTSSTGRFSTEKMDLAAPFGPVTGLTTTLNFTDLLALETAPGQVAQVDRIQAGIDVYDGQVRYQILPGPRVRVESARWPFDGGTLTLEQTILDFRQESEKHLTFHVAGMDAAAFVQHMQFSNIAATGTFDGVVPMIFDQRGGRVDGGHLQARPGGGVVSYIGELTDRQLGTYGKLAFDALKSLRYSKLTVDLNGSLEGEFVAAVELDGVARNAPNPGGIVGHVLHELAKIPFEFNITARGPFRTIISTMRSLKDPTSLIQGALPRELRDQPTTTNVQPKESEDKP